MVDDRKFGNHLRIFRGSVHQHRVIVEQRHLIGVFEIPDMLPESGEPAPLRIVAVIIAERIRKHFLTGGRIAPDQNLFHPRVFGESADFLKRQLPVERFGERPPAAQLPDVGGAFMVFALIRGVVFAVFPERGAEPHAGAVVPLPGEFAGERHAGPDPRRPVGVTLHRRFPVARMGADHGVRQGDLHAGGVGAFGIVDRHARILSLGKGVRPVVLRLEKAGRGAGAEVVQIGMLHPFSLAQVQKLVGSLRVVAAQIDTAAGSA